MGVGGVRRIEVTERESPVFGGAEFGAVGPYERLHGTIFGELDPTHPLNCNSSNLIRQSLLVSETEPGAGRGSHPRWDRDPPSGETEISE